MSDLIRREDAIHAINAFDYRGLTLEDVHKVTDGCAAEVNNLPAVDVEPVRHGRWIQQDDTFTRYMCSECFNRNHLGFENYCPNCGARMDGEK